MEENNYEFSEGDTVAFMGHRNSPRMLVTEVLPEQFGLGTTRYRCHYLHQRQVMEIVLPEFALRSYKNDLGEEEPWDSDSE